MYKQTTVLNDNEILSKTNVETGETKDLLYGKPSNNPNLVAFGEGLPYKKTYKKAWEFLYLKTTPIQHKIACYMAMNASMFSNSLKPLCDEMSLREVAAHLSISHNSVMPALNALFNLGVYAKFEVCEECKEKPSKYWVCNPWLAMDNKVVDKALLDLFKDTDVAKACRS